MLYSLKIRSSVCNAVRGFYPRIHDLRLDAGEWLAQYFQTHLERDVRDLTQVGDLEAFGRSRRRPDANLDACTAGE